MNILIQNLQKWTPFSVVVVLAFLVVVFITVWDTVHNIPLQAYILALLGLFLGGSGATSLVSHGANITNGTLDKVAQISQSLKENSKT